MSRKIILIIVIVLFAVIGFIFWSGNFGTTSSQTSEWVYPNGHCTITEYRGTNLLIKTAYYQTRDLDFRGGLICKIPVNTKLPIFTLTFVPTVDNTFTKIQIVKNDILIQTIDLAGGYIDPNEIRNISEGYILLDSDRNSDGYGDLVFLQHDKSIAEPFWAYYIYDPRNGEFVKQ